MFLEIDESEDQGKAEESGEYGTEPSSRLQWIYRHAAIGSVDKCSVHQHGWLVSFEDQITLRSIAQSVVVVQGIIPKLESSGVEVNSIDYSIACVICSYCKRLDISNIDETHYGGVGGISRIDRWK